MQVFHIVIRRHTWLYDRLPLVDHRIHPFADMPVARIAGQSTQKPALDSDLAPSPR